MDHAIPTTTLHQNVTALIFEPSWLLETKTRDGEHRDLGRGLLAGDPNDVIKTGLPEPGPEMPEADHNDLIKTGLPESGPNDLIKTGLPKKGPQSTP